MSKRQRFGDSRDDDSTSSTSSVPDVMERFYWGPQHDALQRRIRENLEYVRDLYGDLEDDDIPLYNALHQQTGSGYVLNNTGKRIFPRYGASRAYYNLLITPPTVDDQPQTYDDLKDIVSAIIRDIQRTVDPQDWFGMYLNNPHMKEPLWIAARRADQLSAESVMAHFDKISQSLSEFLF